MKRSKPATAAAPATVAGIPDIRPGQSVALLQELHILTRDGKLNQDSRRKLKQVYHLYQFIEPLLNDVREAKGAVSLVDHGAGKSYLGFIIYDLFFKALGDGSHIYGIETREELVARSEELARKFGFPGMSFLPVAGAGGHRHRTARLQYRHRRRDRLRAEEKGQAYCPGALLPGRGGLGAAQEQGLRAGQECAHGIVAPPDSHP
jgi:hypothetical protein